MEDLKIVEYKNGLISQYVFNSCFCYTSKEKTVRKSAVEIARNLKPKKNKKEGVSIGY
jgi:hypothetical protein